MKYDKLITWILRLLFVIGAFITIYGYAVGFELNDSAAVDNILFCAYVFAALTFFAVFIGVVVISGINNPKNLLKLLLGLVVIAGIVAGAYFLAAGTPAVGYLGEPVSDGTLKMTDTVLNLTYLLFGGALLSLVAGAVITAFKK